MLTCTQITELATDYVEGRMGLWDKIRFQIHLGMCADCREYLRQLVVTKNTLPTVPYEPMPDSLKNEMLERFRQWKKNS